MNVVVIGLSHHTSPVQLRERFAFTEGSLPATLEKLRGSGVVNEAVILSTCNRVEIYAATELDPREACKALERFFFAHHQ